MKTRLLGHAKSWIVKKVQDWAPFSLSLAHFIRTVEFEDATEPSGVTPARRKAAQVQVFPCFPPRPTGWMDAPSRRVIFPPHCIHAPLKQLRPPPLLVTRRLRPESRVG